MEDHIKDSSQSSFHSFSPDSAENVGDPNADELNDREDADGNQANKAVPIKYTDGDDKDGRDDMEEDDNILRKQPVKLSINKPSNDNEPAADLDQSPTSPVSPEMLITPKFKEQESIELDHSNLS